MSATLNSITAPAWAITYGWKDLPAGCHPFVAPHYFARRGFVKPEQRGLSIALFATYGEAQLAAKHVRKKNPKARVTRVSVSVAWASGMTSHRGGKR